MADYDLDLDVLAPEPKKVKLNGKLYDVYPPKFKNLVALMKLMGDISGGKDSETTDLKSLAELTNALLPLVPALKDDDMDLTMEQLNSLIVFVMNISTPKDQKELEKQGYTVAQVTEKKTA